jgi:hypothetical protein
MLMIFFGTRLYGRTDRVPGAFFVATEFIHVMLIPVLPIGTWLVLDPMKRSGLAEQEWQGKQLGLGLKSVVVGWSRGLVGAFAVFASAGWPALVATPSSTPSEIRALTLLLAIAWTLFFLIPRFGGQASFARARTLLEQTQQTDAVAQRVARAFKRQVPGNWPGRHPAGAPSPSACSPAATATPRPSAPPAPASPAGPT